MAKVLGVGGVFFKVKDPHATRDWYARVLGVEVNEHGGMDFFHGETAALFGRGARTAFSPFDESADYFAPSGHPFMINLIVDDFDAMLERLEAQGVELVGSPESYAYGRFAWIMDPDGVKLELWEPVRPG